MTVVVILLSATVAGSAQSMSAAESWREVVAAWSAMLERFKDPPNVFFVQQDVSGFRHNDFRSALPTSFGPRTELETKVEIRKEGENACYVIEGLENGGFFGQAMLVNRRYAAELVRTKPNGDWILTRIVRNAPEYEVHVSAIAGRINDYFAGICPVNDVQFLMQDGADSSNQFTCVSVDRHAGSSDDPEHDGELLELVLTPDDSNDKRTYELLIDSGRGMLPVSVSFDGRLDLNGNQGQVVWNCVFEEVYRSHMGWHPKTETSSRSWNGEEYEQWHVETLTLGNTLPSGAKFFTLTDFGLPEPDWARRGIPWYFWLAAAAIIFMFIGAVLLRSARRR